MTNLTIPILSKEEFRSLLLIYLGHDKQNWSQQAIYEWLLDDGFPKLNFEELNTCLKGMSVFLPTVAVEVGDVQFIWVVSGSNAILVEKKPYEKPC